MPDQDGIYMESYRARPQDLVDKALGPVYDSVEAIAERRRAAGVGVDSYGKNTSDLSTIIVDPVNISDVIANLETKRQNFGTDASDLATTARDRVVRHTVASYTHRGN